LTDDGENIPEAQSIFLSLYLITQAIVFMIYHRVKCPPYVLVLLCISKRIHSIFLLRCFNDGIAMMLVYASILFLLHRRHIFASVFFSLALSVKMNVLLFMPGYALVLVRELGVPRAFRLGLLVLLVQVILGLPFLTTFPNSYLTKAFELNRVFTYKWTVNWKFLDEQTFVSKEVAMTLLAGNIGFLILFAWKWCRSDLGLVKLITNIIAGKDVTLISQKRPANKLKQAPAPQATVFYQPQFIFLVLATCNFIGVAFARTLHYQFYSWYFHTLPFLLWNTKLPIVLRLVILAGIEIAFNVYPSTPMSSLVLQAAHIFLLAALFFSPLPPALDVKKLD
jgi:alpha-1,3-mannosyltransferase